MNKFKVAALVLLLLSATFVLTSSPLVALGPFQEGYPPPVEEVPLPVDGQGTPITVTIQPYPPSGTDFNNSSPVPIGGGNGAQTDQGNLTGTTGATSQIIDGAGNRGLVFLWLGFLATFLVFLTSVVGSIILFTRRNDS